VLGTLGRFDELKASGRLEALIRSGLRHCENFAVIDAHTAGETQPVALRWIGPDLVFGRLWQENGLPEAFQATLKTRRFEFDVERAIYSGILKWMTLSLFTYVGTIFVVQIDWLEVMRGTFIPTISFKGEYLAALIAVLGTTISPYLLFWQAGEEVEQMESDPKEKPLKKAPQQASEQLQRIKIDTYVGMAFSNLIAYFIILTAAATLHTHGKTEINSAAEAAEALRPIVGPLAALLFSLGVVGTGLLALPVLGGSAAYALGEALKWPVGHLKIFGWSGTTIMALAAVGMFLTSGK
jgi:Mn2+/Fe2+ NRAMP family transporter